MVVKHEAMAIRRARLASVDREDVDLDTSVHHGLRDVDEEVAGGERVDRSVEALRSLKPDEARALLLKAEGLSYQEIGKQFGWSYTKVNRSITEGRARFLKVFSRLEEGEECSEHEATLSALAAGTATSADVVSIRPHLRHCATCRATVRDMRFSRTRRLALLLPFGWLARLASRSEVAVYSASTGGGRFGPAAALLGICLSGGVAGAACVMTGALPAPPLIAHIKSEPKRPEPPKRVVTRSARRRRRGRRRRPPTPFATPRPVATATATPQRVKTVRKHVKAATGKKRPAATAAREFDFEGTGGSGSAAPEAPRASAASTGGAGGSSGGTGGGTSKPAPSSGSGGGGGGEFSFEGGG